MNNMWQETKKGLYKKFVFDNFDAAWRFMGRVAEIAKQLNHHPLWINNYNEVEIWLISHDQGNTITNVDNDMARDIDALYSGEIKPARKDKDDSVVRLPREVKIHTDGGSRGNPGPSASGFVILDSNGNTLVDRGVYLGITTNNQAEYTALKLALEAARKGGAREVRVFMDSMLVVNQMRGIYKIKNRDLWPIHGAIKEIISHFDKISFTQVPRELNKLADHAVNRALDEQLGTHKADL